MVAVRIPATGHPGPGRGEFQLTWSDGRKRLSAVSWEIVPPIRAEPEAVSVSDASDLNRSEISLRSEDRPFRVLGVRGFDGLTMTAEPSEAATRHRVRLSWPSATRSLPKGIFDVDLLTDHPNQESIPLTIRSIAGH